jgi:hypothetical protein
LLEGAPELVDDLDVLLEECDFHLELLELAGRLVELALEVTVLLLHQQRPRQSLLQLHVFALQDLMLTQPAFELPRQPIDLPLRRAYLFLVGIHFLSGSRAHLAEPCLKHGNCIFELVHILDLAVNDTI